VKYPIDLPASFLMYRSFCNSLQFYPIFIPLTHLIRRILKEQKGGQFTKEKLQKIS